MTKKAKSTRKQPPATAPGISPERAMEILTERIDLIAHEFADVPSSMEYRDALILARAALEKEIGA